MLNGIVTHTRGEWAATTREGRVVRFADHIAYMNHDIEDAVTAGVLRSERHPGARSPPALGEHEICSASPRLIVAVVAHGPEAHRHGRRAGRPPTTRCTTFMYSTVYVDKVAKKEEQKVGGLIRGAVRPFSWKRPPICRRRTCISCGRKGVDRAVTDYISGMSDEYATSTFESLFVPQKWQIL